MSRFSQELAESNVQVFKSGFPTGRKNSLTITPLKHSTTGGDRNGIKHSRQGPGTIMSNTKAVTACSITRAFEIFQLAASQDNRSNRSTKSPLYLPLQGYSGPEMASDFQGKTMDAIIAKETAMEDKKLNP